MKDDPVTDSSLRQFLLGQLDDDQRQRIESRFVIDPEFKERILAVEQDLIEDYLDDSLTKAERESFLLHFAHTPEQQRKLRIARSVTEWAVREANQSPVAPLSISVWSRLLAGLRLKPVFISIAASAMIAIVAGLLWWNFSAGQQHAKNQEELARLNEPANLRETLPGTYTLELPPVTVRSAAPEAKVDRSRNQYVELQLRLLDTEDYPRYRVTLGRFDDNEIFTVDDLHSTGEGNVIRLRLPVSMLKRGLYRIQLTGFEANGAVGATTEYTFNVSG